MQGRSDSIDKLTSTMSGDSSNKAMTRPVLPKRSEAHNQLNFKSNRVVNSVTDLLSLCHGLMGLPSNGKAAHSGIDLLIC